MNIRCFLRFVLLLSIAPAVVAQVWQRPTPEQGCPVEKAQRLALIKKASASLQYAAAVPGQNRPIDATDAKNFALAGSGVRTSCNKDGSCPLVIVKVVPPTERQVCFASIEENTELHVPPPPAGQRQTFVITWALDPAGLCATSKATCQFDKRDGIFMLKNESKQWSVWGAEGMKFEFLDLNEAGFRGAQLDYEPHVFWIDTRGQAQSCCPIDPRIIND